MCELFMPFNKTLVIVVSTRFEIGRHDSRRWREWVENLVRISSVPGNVVAANNRYDQEYIRYFTGIRNVLLLPNSCRYVDADYSSVLASGGRRRPQVLVAPSRGVNPRLLAQLKDAAQQHSVPIAPIRALYSSYSYADLASHPAIVVLPYQVSFMTFFEFYRMNIPLFVPSIRLLTGQSNAYLIRNYTMINSMYYMLYQPVPGAWCIYYRPTARFGFRYLIFLVARV